MPEPLKNLFSHEIIAGMATHLKRAWSGFDRGRFIAIASDDLETLELKERSNQIRNALAACLPEPFERQVEIMLASLHPEDEADLSALGMDDKGIRGWAVMPMSDLVGRRCSDNFDLALEAQRVLTCRFSSEFGIRHLILADPERALAEIRRWTQDSNYHVRRLASEGTRPRLPWAMQLPGFIADPSPTLPVLEALKDDPVEYVRRSVANHVNDISKDHPDLAAALAGRWLQAADGNRRKLVRHACRSLVKTGHPAALQALGFGPPALELVRFDVSTPRVTMGSALEFAATLRSTSEQGQDLAIDYCLHFRKANGKLAPKVFKLKTVRLAAGASLDLERRHPIRPITTRRYYPGLQAVSLQINGAPFGRVEFDLDMDPAAAMRA